MNAIWEFLFCPVHGVLGFIPVLAPEIWWLVAQVRRVR